MEQDALVRKLEEKGDGGGCFEGRAVGLRVVGGVAEQRGDRVDRVPDVPELERHGLRAAQGGPTRDPVVVVVMDEGDAERPAGGEVDEAWPDDGLGREGDRVLGPSRGLRGADRRGQQRGLQDPILVGDDDPGAEDVAARRPEREPMWPCGAGRWQVDPCRLGPVVAVELGEDDGQRDRHSFRQVLLGQCHLAVDGSGLGTDPHIDAIGAVCGKAASERRAREVGAFPDLDLDEPRLGLRRHGPGRDARFFTEGSSCLLDLVASRRTSTFEPRRRGTRSGTRRREAGSQRPPIRPRRRRAGSMPPPPPKTAPSAGMSKSANPHPPLAAARRGSDLQRPRPPRPRRLRGPRRPTRPDPPVSPASGVRRSDTIDDASERWLGEQDAATAIVRTTRRRATSRVTSSANASSRLDSQASAASSGSVAIATPHAAVRSHTLVDDLRGRPIGLPAQPAEDDHASGIDRVAQAREAFERVGERLRHDQQVGVVHLLESDDLLDRGRPGLGMEPSPERLSPSRRRGTRSASAIPSRCSLRSSVATVNEATAPACISWSASQVYRPISSMNRSIARRGTAPAAGWPTASAQAEANAAAGCRAASRAQSAGLAASTGMMSQRVGGRASETRRGGRRRRRPGRGHRRLRRALRTLARPTPRAARARP